MIGEDDVRLVCARPLEGGGQRGGLNLAEPHSPGRSLPVSAVCQHYRLGHEGGQDQQPGGQQQGLQP